MYKELCTVKSIKEILKDCNLEDDKEILISAGLIFAKILSDEKDKEFSTNSVALVEIIQFLRDNLNNSLTPFVI